MTLVVPYVHLLFRVGHPMLISQSAVRHRRPIPRSVIAENYMLYFIILIESGYSSYNIGRIMSVED